MTQFSIRLATESDFEAICGIYSDARAFMRENGNPHQWKDDRPTQDTIARDIKAGKSHVCIGDKGIVAVFYFSIEEEPTYGRIDGAWINDEPYGVVHRIARSRDASAKGAGKFCMEWSYEQCRNLRVDTHRDNGPMRALLESLRFAYCGIIWLEDGDERLAYQKAAGK